MSPRVKKTPEVDVVQATPEPSPEKASATHPKGNTKMSTTTLVGNLTADPTVRFTHNGTAVSNFTVASTPRRFDKEAGAWADGETLFMKCTVFGKQAENMTEQLRKGARVVVTGSLTQSNYTDKDGNARSSIELDVDEVASSVRFTNDGGATVTPPAQVVEPVTV